MEVDGVDDQRIAFPPPARVSAPLPDTAVSASVKGNDPGVVHHLVDEDDVVARLKELNDVGVCARLHRRARVESKDAALRHVSILRTGRPVAPSTKRPSLLSLGGQRRDSAVWRVDNQ